MLGKSPKLSDHSAKGRKAMNAAIEARDLIAGIAGPQPLGHSIKAALRDVARKTGLNDRRIRALWNSEARAILSDEMDRLRQTYALEEARHAQRKIRSSIARAEDALGIYQAQQSRHADHDDGGEGGSHYRALATED